MIADTHAAETAAKLATYGGGGSALVFGLTPSEWSVIGVIGGILIGIAGLIVTAYYKREHFRLAERRGYLPPLNDGKDADD
jgi:hypothetical protein